MLDFSRFEAISFDCYGTLIDWEAGILLAIRSVLDAHEVRPSDDEVLRAYSELEASHERVARSSFMRYREVLQSVMRDLGERFGVTLSPLEIDRLPASLARWPAFPDTASSLAQLKRRYRLAVFSNIDADLFQDSAPKLGVELDELVTAEFCRSYKPDPRHWRVGLAMLDLPADRVLHVAESVVHDIIPAKALGFSTVWVNRRGARGFGASGNPGDSPYAPDLEVPSLAALVELMAPRSA